MKQIGKYEVCGLLGKGGMGTVYKVRMPVVGKVVALKLFRPHPNLVTLLGEMETCFKGSTVSDPPRAHQA